MKYEINVNNRDTKFRMDALAPGTLFLAQGTMGFCIFRWTTRVFNDLRPGTTKEVKAEELVSGKVETFAPDSRVVVVRITEARFNVEKLAP